MIKLHLVLLSTHASNYCTCHETGTVGCIVKFSDSSISADAVHRVIPQNVAGHLLQSIHIRL